MKKQKQKASELLKNASFSISDFESEIEVEKTKDSLLNKKEKEVKEKIEKTKLTKEEKQKLTSLILKLKNDIVKDKNYITWKIEVIKKTWFSIKDAKELNKLIKKYNESKAKEKKEKIDSRMNLFMDKIKNEKKYSENLFFMNWKTNKKYIDSIENENRKILYSEYIKLQNIWKKEKDLIKSIEFERIKFDKTLKFIDNFSNEMKKKNSKDIKLLNAYFLKSNIAKNIKNSKLIKEVENDNIYWKSANNFESQYIEKVNRKFIVDIIKNENEKEVEKIKSFLNSIDFLKSWYNLKWKTKKEYINSHADDILKKSNRILKKYIDKNWNIEKEKIKTIKKQVLSLYKKELQIIKNVKSAHDIEYKNYNKQYKNLQNKIKYTSKSLKDRYSYLLSE